MTKRQTNPWPAFADLFAALLVVTFAAFFFVANSVEQEKREVVDLKSRLETLRDADERLAQLSAENALLNANLDAGRAEIASLESDRRLLQEKMANLEGVQDRLEVQITNLERGLGKGIGPPPCLIENDKVAPLLEVEVFDDGLQANALPLSGHAELVKGIPGFDSLVSSGRITLQSFLDLAEPVRAWGRNENNELGFECVFFAYVVLGTTSKERVSKALAYIDDRFYLSNVSEIDRFMKR